MTGDHIALIPHTLGRSSREALVEELRTRVPALEVRGAATPSETIAGFDEASILITMGFREDWYGRLDAIEWIQVLSAGVNHIDLNQIGEADVVLTNASGVHADPIAQQVLGYMLMFERNLLTAVNQQHRGVWERFRGGELGGKTVGIIGLGAIGSAVARLCDALDMEVIGTKRDTSVEIDHVDRLYGPSQLETVLAEAAYLVLACPLTEETRGLIDADALRIMQPDAILINIARGGIVDESALVTALQQGRIGGAGLDVFAEEPLPSDSMLWELSNVILTPHMAGSTPRYWTRCAELIADNFDTFVAGKPEAMGNRIV